MKDDGGSAAVLGLMLIVLIIVVALVVPWTLELIDTTGGDEGERTETTDYAILGAIMCVSLIVLVLIWTRFGS